MRCACRRGQISTRNTSVSLDPLNPAPLTPGASPGFRDPLTPGPSLTPYPPLPSRDGELTKSPQLGLTPCPPLPLGEGGLTTPPLSATESGPGGEDSGYPRPRPALVTPPH